MPGRPTRHAADKNPTSRVENLRNRQSRDPNARSLREGPRCPSRRAPASLFAVPLSSNSDRGSLRPPMSVSRFRSPRNGDTEPSSFQRRRNWWLGKGEMGPFSTVEFLSEFANSRNGMPEDATRHATNKNSNIERSKYPKSTVRKSSCPTSEKNAPNALRRRDARKCFAQSRP